MYGSFTKQACNCDPKCVDKNFDKSIYKKIKYAYKSSLENNIKRVNICRPFAKLLGFDTIRSSLKFKPIATAYKIRNGIKSLCHDSKLYDRISCDASRLKIKCDGLKPCDKIFLGNERKIECSRPGLSDDLVGINLILGHEIYTLINNKSRLDDQNLNLS